MRVWREKEKWTGPFRLIAIDATKQVCTVKMPYRPTNFRTTVVKLYFRDEDPETIALDSKALEPNHKAPEPNLKALEPNLYALKPNS